MDGVGWAYLVGARCRRSARQRPGQRRPPLAGRVEKCRVVNVSTGGGGLDAGERRWRGRSAWGRKDCREEMDRTIARGKEGSRGGRSAGCVIDGAERNERAGKEGSWGGEGSHDGAGDGAPGV